MDASNKLEIPKREAWLRIRRYAVPIFIGLVILLVLGTYFWTRESRDPLELACEEIEEGMAIHEALGVVKRTAVPPWTISRTEIRRTEDDPGMMIVYSDKGRLKIIHSGDGLVVKKGYREFHRESFFDRL